MSDEWTEKNTDLNVTFLNANNLGHLYLQVNRT